MKYTIVSLALLAMFGTLIAAAPVARAASSIEIVTTNGIGNPQGNVRFEIYTLGTEELNFRGVTDSSSGSFLYVIDKAGRYYVILFWGDGIQSKETIEVSPGYTKYTFKRPRAVPPPALSPVPSGLTRDEFYSLCKYARNFGSRSEKVQISALQDLLRKVGLLTAASTGFYGPQTDAAAKKALATFCQNIISEKQIMEAANTVSTDSTSATVVGSVPTVDAPPQYPSVTNENTKAAAALLQDLIVQMRQLLGQFEKALSLLRSS